MITLFDDEHIQKMYEKGIRKVSKTEGARKVAARMYSDNMPLDRISKYVGYPAEVLAAWLGIQPTKTEE